MKINKFVTIILGILLLSGCGDQFWCGEDGCPGKSMTITSDNPTSMNI